MRSIIRRNLFIGGCSIAIGILLFLTRGWLPRPEKIILIAGIMGAAGLLFLAISTFRQSGVGETPGVIDERILKIRAYTFMKAFLFSFTVVCLLGILNLSGLLVMDSRSVIEIVFFTMGLSSTLLSWYYNRQGDISEG